MNHKSLYIIMAAMLIASSPELFAAQIGDPVVYTPPRHHSVLCVVIERTQYVSLYDIAHSQTTYKLRSMRPKQVIDGRFIYAEFTGVTENDLAFPPERGAK